MTFSKYRQKPNSRHDINRLKSLHFYQFSMALTLQLIKVKISARMDRMKKTITITTLLSALMLLVFSQTAWSNEGIRCHNPTMSKEFEIKNNSITFFTVDEYDQGRTIASLSNIRTKKEAKGFTKVVKFEGNRYLIHIADTENYSEINDYMVIKSQKGHNITYPLICK